MLDELPGEFLDSKSIEVKTIILEKDNDESKEYLLFKLNEELDKIRPFCVTGYGIIYYDIPLLLLNK